MSVTHPKVKNQVRVRRARKVIDKRAEKLEVSICVSSANSVYAGYPYDPYA
jgi:hypothetical protein